RNAAVDDVFAVVTRVVPTTGHVEGVRARRTLWPTRFFERRLRCARHLVLGVTRGSSPLLLSRERHLQLDARTRVIEIRERVVTQLVVDTGSDLERVALVVADLEHEAFPRRLIRGEVDPVHLVARRGVLAFDDRLTAGNHGTRRVEELPSQRLRRVADCSRKLRALGEVALLVDTHGGQRLLFRLGWRSVLLVAQ